MLANKRLFHWIIRRVQENGSRKMSRENGTELKLDAKIMAISSAQLYPIDLPYIDMEYWYYVQHSVHR